MTIQIETITLGPLENNTIVLLDEASKTAAVVDPSYGADAILEPITKQGFTLSLILLTHAHFDHIAGAAALSNSSIPNIPVHLHADDLPLWQQEGGAPDFGFHIELCDSVLTDLVDGQVIPFGGEEIHVYHTPGHTRGHVIFHLPSIQTALVGDLIFREGVGRTDLPGGNGRQLIQSIRSKVLTLPPATILIPGHGPSTTVEYEMRRNPFL